MEQNSLIEFGSRANVVIRFIANTSINDKDYTAGEPFLFLKDVLVGINYGNNSKVTGVSPKNLAAFSDVKPQSISIRGMSFSRKIASMLACFKGQSDFNQTKFIDIEPFSQEAFLTEQIDNTTSFYVYDENFNFVQDVFYEETVEGEYITPKLRSVNFVDGQTYLFSFSSAGLGTRFDLIKPSIPYMSIEVQSVGNVGKTGRKVLLFFGKVALDSVLNLAFLQEGTVNIPLDFIILDGENYMIFEEGE